MKIFSPAKVNLFLKVGSKRDDGFHNIVTLMQALTLTDMVHLSPGRNEIHITSCGYHVPHDDSNLAYIAAMKLRKMYAITEGVNIHIDKRIPVSAGLGGGSSNAAATLKGLRKMWNLQCSDNELARLGSEIGSDVPFFLKVPTACARGRGEVLEPVENRCEWHYVLVNPGFSVSTKWAYSQVKMMLTRKDKNINLFKVYLENGDYERVEKNLHNDFEDLLISKYPMLGKIKKELVYFGATASLMSGSGPTVFGMFRDKSTAEKACMKLKAQNKNTVLAKTLLEYSSP